MRKTLHIFILLGVLFLSIVHLFGFVSCMHLCSYIHFLPIPNHANTHFEFRKCDIVWELEGGIQITQLAHYLISNAWHCYFPLVVDFQEYKLYNKLSDPIHVKISTSKLQSFTKLQECFLLFSITSMLWFVLCLSSCSYYGCSCTVTSNLSVICCSVIHCQRLTQVECTWPIVNTNIQ